MSKAATLELEPTTDEAGAYNARRMRAESTSFGRLARCSDASGGIPVRRVQVPACFMWRGGRDDPPGTARR